MTSFISCSKHRKVSMPFCVFTASNAMEIEIAQVSTKSAVKQRYEIGPRSLTNVCIYTIGLFGW